MKLYECIDLQNEPQIYFLWINEIYINVQTVKNTEEIILRTEYS